MLSAIVALCSKNFVIGKNNDIPWHLSEDLKRFKQLTINKTIIMGRKTFESLPNVLPNRNHIVITNSLEQSKNKDESVFITNDLQAVIKTFKDSENEAFIIGGATIYRQALPFCKKLYITFIETEFEGDTFFPYVDFNQYKETEKSNILIDKKTGIKYRYINYTNLNL